VLIKPSEKTSNTETVIKPSEKTSNTETGMPGELSVRAEHRRFIAAHRARTEGIGTIRDGDGMAKGASGVSGGRTKEAW